jgi:hypothetical protein
MTLWAYAFREMRARGRQTNGRLASVPIRGDRAMTPSASFDLSKPNERHGVLWASVVAIFFAAVAAISFAVDQSVTLSSLPTQQSADQ